MLSCLSMLRRVPGYLACSALIAAALTLALARCTSDGLDDYSAEFGRDASGAGESLDATKEGAGDSAQPDALGAPDAFDSAPACACAPGEVCVNGMCRSCPPTWSLDLGDITTAGEALDRNTSRLYVAGSDRASDAGPQGGAPGYLAVIDACDGKLVSALNPPSVANVALGALQYPLISGKNLYARVAASAPAPNGYARLDLATAKFDRVLPQLGNVSSGSDTMWQMAAAPNGELWLSGTANSEPGPPMLAVGKSAGSGAACFASTGVLGVGRAIAASGSHVYVIAVGAGLTVAHFNGADCALTSPCTCAPSWQSTMLDLGTTVSTARRARVVGNTLFVVGYALVHEAGVDARAYVVAFDTVSRTWGDPSFWDPTTAYDTFLDFDADTTHLYVSLSQGLDGAFLSQGLDGASFASASAKVLVFPLKFSSATKPTVLDVPRLRAAGGLALDPRGGLVLSGTYDALGAKGRAIRCTLQGCPP